MNTTCLKTNRVCIEPTKEEHFEMLYKWVYNDNNRYLWTNLTEAPLKSDYISYLDFAIKNQFKAHFIIYSISNKSPVGVIYISDYEHLNNLASFTIYILPNYQNFVYGIEAVYLLFEYAFRENCLRKLYLDIYGYNTLSLRLAQKAGFNLEGVFKRHKQLSHGYTDKFRYSIFQSEWEVKRKHFKTLGLNKYLV